MIAADPTRLVGAALGACGAPAAALGALWSGHGAAPLWVFAAALGVGTVVGYSLFPLFSKTAQPGLAMAGGFASCAGLLGGLALGGAPGALFGGCAALVGGAMVAWCWSRLTSPRPAWRALSAWGGGALTSTLVTWTVLL